MSIYFVEKPKSEKDLQHWKYIKKVRKPNGKFRYYYEHDELVEDVKEKVKETVDNVKDKIGFDEKERYKKAESEAKSLAEEAEKVYKEGDAMYKEYMEDGSLSMLEFANLDAKAAEYLLTEEVANMAKEKSEKLLKEYEKTPLYKLEKASAAVADGFRTIKNFFKKR